MKCLAEIGSRTRRAARSPSLLLALLLLPVVFPSAESRPVVQCDALVGWNGAAREGRFAPLLVSVESSAAKLAVDVRVGLTWGSSLRGSLFGRTFTRGVLLAGGTTRRVPFLIPIMRDARSLSIGVFSQGTELARVDIDLRPVVTSQTLVAGISSELSLDALAELSGESMVRVVYPRVDDLPETWGGYDALDMVVVHDTGFQHLRAAQVTAMERWVATGGTLVFTGGADALQHAPAGMARLLPVEVLGLREQGDLWSLAPFLGLARGPRGKMIIADSRVTTGKVLVSQDGMPIIVERRQGRGAIWFIAFDPTLPPLDSWEGTRSLWRLVKGSRQERAGAESGRQPALESVIRDPVDDPWMKTLLDNPPLSFPSAVAVLAFAVCYLALLFPLVLGRFSRAIPSRLRAVLLVAVPVAACAAGFLLFNRAFFSPGAVLLDAAKVEIDADGMALVTERLGLIAARAGSCELSLQSPDVTVDEVSPAGASPLGIGGSAGHLTVEVGERTVLRDLGYGRFGSRLFILKAVTPMPISAAVAPLGSGFQVVVANDASRPLRGCFLSRNGRAYHIGDIAPGSTVSRTFTPGDGLDMKDPGARARIAGGIRRGDLWGLAGAEPGNGPGVLAGWLDGSALSVAAAGADRLDDRPALSLVVVDVRVAEAR